MLNLKNIFLLFLLSTFIVACGDPVPVQEMSKAKNQITKAVLVKADKYAIEELKAANTNLHNSHDSVADEKMDDAKKQAETSYEFAKKAYNKAVILLAKDTISEAEASLNLANEAYAEEFAKVNYEKATALLKKSNEYFENKKYYIAYKYALSADTIAKSARNVALSKEGVLFDAIREVNDIIKKTQNYDYQKHANEKYTLATENLDLAIASHKELKLKVGFSAVEIAKLNAEEAYQLALEGTAKFEFVKAEDAVNNASESDGATVASDELEASKESLNNSKISIGDSKYLESIVFSKEAYRLASIVQVTKKPVVEPKVVIKEEKVDDGYFYYKVKYKQNYKDCLWRIARKYYKNPKKWKRIYKANKKMIKNPHLILPGWVIRIPK